MTATALGTEQKIKEAARKIFHEKGFDATRTRDIAEAAGINLALLNYYFRSKKKLYDIVMMETMEQFFGNVWGVMNDENTTLREKFAMFIEQYIDTLSANPNMPLFIMTEARKDAEGLFKKLTKTINIKDSVFLKQVMQEMQAGNMTMNVNPIHWLMNVVSMVVFPFAVAPIIKTVVGVNDSDFNALMQERKRLIPLWVETLLQS